ncbi:MAG TPA: 16S rRNA (guanine(527)-N(7))-methyltransferase RsmG [Polyangiaceae bacterium]|nr:16S rRNA (guanine(527)-N(7))-methyltransferase RsmG [Polyangiaceae bacterium]
MTVPSPSDPAANAVLSQLGQREQARLAEYLDLFLHSAQLFNLTAIRDRDEAWARHVVESVRLVPLLGGGKRLIDVGSGGGVPGLVLAIACPDIAVTLLEATAKKARFLEQTGKALGLENLTVVCDRAESAGSVGSPQRERFDVVTARAVAPLRVLLELTSPLAKVGGLIVAVKGEKASEELGAAATALNRLHVTHEQTVRHPTASVVLLRKTAATAPKYPRRAGEPTRSPL